MGLRELLKEKPLASDKWALIKDHAAIHLYGKKPTRIFKTRRPLESTNEFALSYREENWQPITKQPFQVAISAISECTNHIYVQYENVTDGTSDYLDDVMIKAAGRTYDYKDYILNYIGAMVEYDPNAVLAHIPRHPDGELIADYREELPNFNDVLNQSVDLWFVLVSSDNIQYIDDDLLRFYGGEWIYKVVDGREMTKPYYWELTAEATRLIIPYEVKDGYDYRHEDYYFNDLEKVPFDIIGDNPIIEEIDGQWIEFQEVTFSGAISIANKLVGIDSDNDILQTRYTYPERIIQYKACSHPGCFKESDKDSPYFNLFVNRTYDEVTNTSSCSVCSTCEGSGMIAPDSSPLASIIITKGDAFDDDGRYIPPVQFITPPIEAPRHMAEQVDKLWEKMHRALFILNQNMTNQSGESKGYDVRQKVQVIGNACRNRYSILEKSMNTVQGFLRGEQDIEIIMPPDLNVKQVEDITMELSESAKTSSLYTAQLTKELLLKRWGNNARNRKAVDFLELADRLFGFTMEEIIKAKALYGTDLTSRDQVVHDKGWAVLQKLAKEEGFEMWTDEQLRARFEEEIDKLAPPPTIESPIA